MYIRKDLSCGIPVIAEKLDNFRSCTVGVWVRAGSVTESNGENGLSHFIEHMLFKGTEKRTARQIAVDTDNLGGQINAFTSKECTCYYIKFIDKRLDDAIELLSDIFLNAVFDEEELDKERSVILEEIAMYNDSPDDVVHEIVASAFFGGTPLEKTILGPADNISNYSKADLIKYYNKRYALGNIAIAAAGSFDEQKLFDCLEKYFCTDKFAEYEAAAVADTGLNHRQRNVSAYRDIEQAHICLAFPGFSITDNRRYNLSVINNIIGGSMSSRLFQSIREERGLAYSVYSYPSVYVSAGSFSIYAGSMLKNLEEVQALIHKELEDMLINGFSKEEFEQSKEQLKGSFILSLESTSAKMNSIGKVFLLTGKVKTDDEIMTLINNTDYKESVDLLPDIIDFDKCTSGVVGKISK